MQVPAAVLMVRPVGLRMMGDVAQKKERKQAHADIEDYSEGKEIKASGQRRFCPFINAIRTRTDVATPSDAFVRGMTQALL